MSPQATAKLRIFHKNYSVI